jgi:hypothetical protein
VGTIHNFALTKYLRSTRPTIDEPTNLLLRWVPAMGGEIRSREDFSDE